MVGVAGCGKTTYATSRFKGYTIISMDELRERGGIYGDIIKRGGGMDGNTRRLSKWRRAENVLIEEAMARKEDIVIDDTNLTRKVRSIHISRAKRYHYTIRGIFIDRSRAAFSQNRKRKRQVPGVAIYHHIKDLERPAMEEGFDSIRVIF